MPLKDRNSEAERDVKRILATAFLCLLACACSLLLLELSARVILAHLASDDEFTLYAAAGQMQSRAGEARRGRYSPHRYAGYYPTPNWGHARRNRNNSLGFRGSELPIEKPTGAFRIAFLGGSTTYCQVERDKDTYPYLVEQFLHEEGATHVEVINAGASGYTTWESLVTLQFRVIDSIVA